MAKKGGKREEYITQATAEYQVLFEKQYGILLTYEEAEKQMLNLLALYKALLPNELFESDLLDDTV